MNSAKNISNSRSKIPVAITGLGCVSPFGVGKNAFYQGLAEARSGTGKLSCFRDDILSSQVVAQVPDFDPLSVMDSLELKRVPRVVPMAIQAAKEAFACAKLDVTAMDTSQSRNICVIVGTGGGGIEFAEKQYEAFYGNGLRNVTPYCVSSSFVGMLSSEISIYFGLKGLSHVISTGCTSSTDALGYAYQMIASGQESIVLSGGAEACITPGLMAGFCRMKVISTGFNDTPERASRPFDKKRDGFVLGEGSWMYVLESLDSALERQAPIYGLIESYASTCDAYHRVAASKDAIESARAMSLALEKAQLNPSDIDYINLHGTGTQLNDVVETKAVKMVFQDTLSKLKLSATKSQIGHPQGACGSAGVAACLFAIENDIIPATINQEESDPDCNLDVTANKPVSHRVNKALCNTIAFGSKNSSLVISRFDRP